MTESKIFADNYSCAFSDPESFLEFLGERKENSAWLTAPSRSIQFEPIEKDTPKGNLYMQLYELNGKAELLADTMENTSIMLSINDQSYPVRSCALKTILERARISGNALSKVSTGVFTQILNYCMNVASGDSLIKVADEKVSAVHGGDPKDYSVLEMLPLFQHVKDFLDFEFPGNQFITANYDHSQVSAIWSLDGQAQDLLQTYERELTARGLSGKGAMRPALRFTTSDVGTSGANLYPIFLTKSGNRIIPLGYPLKTAHEHGADLDRFDEQMGFLYSRFKEAIEKQSSLLDIEVRYPYTTMLGVLKRIGAPKKASYEAADLFAAQQGDRPCTAYEIYLAMSEVIFISQCNGASGTRIAQLEEILARALNINWHEYDRPGDFKW
ncbi:MAG: transposase [Bacillota bacterium]|nr:transposase [Bacillota bacterium]